MKIKSISFSNFKYVSKERTLRLNLPNAESLILGGPNGYGKTTVFDALELLITGEIRHFNADLPNKGKESICVLANDATHDFCVAAEFVSDGKIIEIKRQFRAENNFESYLTVNEESIVDEQVFSLLGISKNLFELGIYISQMDSLNFLQQKYKARKESVIGILDSSYIENRFGEIKKIQELLKVKFDEEEKKRLDALSKVDNERAQLANALKVLQLSQEDIPYVKLFENKEYIFDKEFFDKDDLYEAIIAPVNDLIEFCKYEQAFFVIKRNMEIRYIVEIDKKIFAALFFVKEIAECLKHSKIISLSTELLKLKDSCQVKNFYLSETIIEALELNEKVTIQVNELLLQKRTIEKGMSDTQAALSKILKQRSDFLVSYNNSISEKVLPERICPLCGRESEALSDLFSSTEDVLKSNLGLVATQLTNLVMELTNLFSVEVIPKANLFLESHKGVIEKHNLLFPYLQIDTTELREKLKSENITFSNLFENVDFAIFETKYLETINELSGKLTPETEVVSAELYAKLLRISLQYYSESMPYDESVLMKKKFYISAMFSNSFIAKLQDAEVRFTTLHSSLEKIRSGYANTSENIGVIIKKFDAAKKLYQSSIAKNIAVPMFIFSGKIIQNYPLGLGILIEVDNNAIVFKTEGIKSDIFNNLSTGQLNGVVISLLLSIKEVFATSGSLNTLLIDDPLQTIDEVSAISLIDLLSEHFGDTQILLSTHEDDKQFLMKKKYEQSGKRCSVFNMQEEYLSQ